MLYQYEHHHYDNNGNRVTTESMREELTIFIIGRDVMFESVVDLDGARIEHSTVFSSDVCTSSNQGSMGMSDQFICTGQVARHEKEEAANSEDQRR